MLYRVLFRLALCAILVTLAGCGGGSTSGGSGNFTVGKYRGFQVIELNGEAADSTIGQFVTADVTGDGTFLLRSESGGLILRAVIFRNRIEFSGPAAVLLRSGCSGDILLNVDVAPNRLVGSYSGNGTVCDGFAVTVSGNFDLGLIQ